MYNTKAIWHRGKGYFTCIIFFIITSKESDVSLVHTLAYSSIFHYSHAINPLFDSLPLKIPSQTKKSHKVDLQTSFLSCCSWDHLQFL